jgi:uncharacterized protein
MIKTAPKGFLTMRNKMLFLPIFLTILGASPAFAGDEFSAMRSMMSVPKDDAPPVDEYTRVKKGVLMPDEVQTENGNAAAGQGMGIGGQIEHVLTMDEITELYKQRKYDEITPSLKVLSNNGHHAAEEMLGVLYRAGLGVEKDPVKAFTMLSKAAEANRPVAQHHIGVMNFTGEGTQVDMVKAMMWLKIAIVHYDDGPEKDRAQSDHDNVFLRLTRREKERAEEMARDWLEKRGEAHLLELH